MTATHLRAERVGIFGGTFDPLHNGHLRIAAAVLKQHRLDRIIFVPARVQPHKTAPPRAPGRHSLAMIRLSIRDNPHFSVSDCELRRPGVSFTIDTIRQLRRRFRGNADLYFIVGSDTVPELPRWRNVKELTRLCTIIIAARPDWPIEALDALAGRLPPNHLARIRELAVRTTANPISSTDIRERLAQGRPIRRLVPLPVADYIARHKLYAFS